MESVKACELSKVDGFLYQGLIQWSECNGLIVLGMTVFGGVGTLGLWIGKGVECFKWDLVGHISRSIGDNDFEGDLNCGSLT